MSFRTISDEVVLATGGIVRVTAADVELLAERARTNARRRCRLCTHPDSRDRLHEMLIVLDRETYIRPHRHAGKSESFHIVEGELDVAIFHDDGALREVVKMGPYGSGRAFFYRLMENCFHSVLIRTPFALFHETTNGPFDRSDTEFAPWSPVEGDPEVRTFVEKMRALVDRSVRQAA